MEKQERPKRPSKPKPSQSSKSDTPTPTEKDKTAKVGDRYFKKTTYIKGFGIVNAGDKLTGEMAKAWSTNTPVKIDAYVGKSEDKLSELPKSDKEKLAEYEALNED